MRLIFTILVLIFAVSVNAQTVLPGGYLYHLQQPSFSGINPIVDSSASAKKWFVSKSVGFSTSVGFFNGGNATVMAVPIGLQINRRLTNNWYAFAGVSAAPAYVNFNHSFLTTNKFTQGSNFQQSNRLNIYTNASMGLMYVNDQKTFSISGSIGIEKSTYPLVPFNQMGIARQNSFFTPTR